MANIKKSQQKIWKTYQNIKWSSFCKIKLRSFNSNLDNIIPLIISKQEKALLKNKIW